MAKRLADVYKSLFQFYREAMEYFVSSAVSKFFKAFNSELPAKHQGALTAIEEQIKEMDREAQISNIAMQRFELGLLQNMDARHSRDLAEIKQLIVDMRQANVKPSVEPGQAALRFLLAGLQAGKRRQQLQPSAVDATASSPIQLLTTLPKPQQSRREALKYFEDLEDFLIGDDGSALIGERAGNWRASQDVLAHIETWMQTTESTILWIETPFSVRQDDTAKSAAMGVIESVWTAGINFISHLCERPRESASDDMTPIEAGIIGLVYSLIYQLLQFGVEDDDIDLSKERFDSLASGLDSWSESLALLQDLLMGTYSLPFCIIHGLNELERSEGMEMCDEVLQVLFECQRERDTVFKILLTTSGQSRLLSQQDEPISHCLSRTPAKRVLRQGRQIQLHREASSFADDEDEAEEDE